MIYWIRKEVSFRKLETEVKLGQFERAHQRLDELLTRRPKDRDVLMQKAWVFLEEKKYPAMQSFISSIEAHEEDPIYLMLLGEAALHQKQLDQAESFLLKSITLSPDNLRSEYSLGLVYVAKSDFLNAAKWFENSIKYDKNLVQSKILAAAEHYLYKQNTGP